MRVTFVELPEFTCLAKTARLTASERRELESVLCTDPRAGHPISGTGGVRKVRFALEQSGKRGGGRAIYYYVEQTARVYLIAVYKKSISEGISHSVKRQLRGLARILADEG